MLCHVAFGGKAQTGGNAGGGRQQISLSLPGLGFVSKPLPGFFLGQDRIASPAPFFAILSSERDEPTPPARYFHKSFTRMILWMPTSAMSANRDSFGC